MQQNKATLTFDPNDVDLPKNEPIKDTSGVNLHSPTNFGEGRPKRTRDVREQTETDKQTDRQMTFDPNDLDLPKNEPLKGNSGVKLHPPTKFHPNWTQDLRKKT